MTPARLQPRFRVTDTETGEFVDLNPSNYNLDDGVVTFKLALDSIHNGLRWIESLEPEVERLPDPKPEQAIFTVHGIEVWASPDVWDRRGLGYRLQSAEHPDAEHVSCYPIKRQGWGWPDNQREATKVPATYWTRPSGSRLVGYRHRIRSSTWSPGASHGQPPLLHTWCGQMVSLTAANGPRIASPAPPSVEPCGTCEGRAVGAGQIDQPSTTMVFTPNVPETWEPEERTTDATNTEFVSHTPVVG